MAKAHVVDASTAKNTFGTLAQKAKSAPVEITRHGRLESVLISPEMYQELKTGQMANRSDLQRLQASFDQMVAQMQSPKSEAAYAALESLTPKDLSAAAVAAYKRVHKKGPLKSPRLRVVR